MAETVKHAAYPATIWALEPDQKGLLPVAKNRGGPVKIAWEIHGTGPTKLVVCLLTPVPSLPPIDEHQTEPSSSS